MRASPHLSKQVPHRCLCLLVCNGNRAVIQLVLHIKWGPALMHQTWCKHGSRNACTLILTLRSDLLNSSPELHNTLHKRTHACPPTYPHPHTSPEVLPRDAGCCIGELVGQLHARAVQVRGQLCSRSLPLAGCSRCCHLAHHH